jgi:hypothetical protein
MQVTGHDQFQQAGMDYPPKERHKMSVNSKTILQRSQAPGQDIVSPRLAEFRTLAQKPSSKKRQPQFLIP